MTSADGSTTNQTGSPVWFGVETSSSFHGQRLFAKLSARAVQWTARVEAFSKLPPRVGLVLESVESDGPASSVYGGSFIITLTVVANSPN